MNQTLSAVAALVDRMSSETFDPDVFRQTGVFVMRRAIPEQVVRAWQDEWRTFYDARLRDGRDVNRANPVSLSEELPEGLARMYREPVFAHTLRHIFGEHVALYNHRFVIKDRFSPGKVFLHQDSCYHAGNLNKCSLFVPLSIVNRDNGGMTFHAGSHKLGVLGDAGEINPDSFDFKWPAITPELAPGDFVVMHSALWHESGPNVSGVDRILADTIVQPADDPTGKELLCGTWQTDLFYSPQNFIRYFVNSRVLKLIKYEKERAQASGGN
ncbi:phytanoyl-CoA dioxygenase family protein [Burkholderia alba]|uniref:phytanoyl-CoA dioxygenase family protein n=1 Tax=Burkholderia alba TaxID=2683677 RepID=UPI002B055A50|nr:phytanoyl-CoA dioxygenase family protein [Burkholderia alba]